jgi:hypothetical protein
VREHENEPVRGLPEILPSGETILWQGAPSWQGLALRALHVRGIAIYFALLFAWIAGSTISEGTPVPKALTGLLSVLPVAVLALGVLTGFAWLVHRTTVYTVTNRRVVLRFGTALPMTMNVPFSVIDTAGLKVYGDGTGDIPLKLDQATKRQSLVVLWPHVRPWRTVKPEPMLRAVPDARRVAQILASALAASAAARGVPASVSNLKPAPRPAPDSVAAPVAA